ncbi:hypothetical protein HDV57DRAFT_442990 [Trichoderma longibrachiatum]
MIYLVIRRVFCSKPIATLPISSAHVKKHHLVALKRVPQACFLISTPETSDCRLIILARLLPEAPRATPLQNIICQVHLQHEQPLSHHEPNSIQVTLTSLHPHTPFTQPSRQQSRQLPKSTAQPHRPPAHGPSPMSIYSGRPSRLLSLFSSSFSLFFILTLFRIPKIKHLGMQRGGPALHTRGVNSLLHCPSGPWEAQFLMFASPAFFIVVLFLLAGAMKKKICCMMLGVC